MTHPGITEKGDLCAHGRSLRERIDHFAPDDLPPQRRHRLVLDLSFDDIDDLPGLLDTIARDVARSMMASTSGSPSHGWHWELITRKDVTAVSFQRELAAWMDARHGR